MGSYGKILSGMRLIAPDQSFTWTFDREGIYPYLYSSMGDR